MPRPSPLAAVTALGLLSVAAAPGGSLPAERVADLTATVARMARIGSAGGASFSPDGKWIAYTTNLSGMPQLWVVPAAGGYPRMVTSGEDPVVVAEWSPTSEWIAVGIAPGGGLNTQIYVVRPDGTALRRLTDGGKENNGFNAWRKDGAALAIDSNRRDPASRDAFVVDLASGSLELVAKNPGVGSISSFSRDGSRALLFRLRSRGNNDLYLLDLRSKTEMLLTPHEGVASFFGEISPDGSTVYLATNQDRDRMAFGRIRITSDGKPRPIDILAERPDAELDSLALSEQGSLAALSWNVNGRPG